MNRSHLVMQSSEHKRENQQIESARTAPTWGRKHANTRANFGKVNQHKQHPQGGETERTQERLSLT
jgi:hypothetical protein